MDRDTNPQVHVAQSTLKPPLEHFQMFHALELRNMAKPQKITMSIEVKTKPGKQMSI